MFVQRLGYQMDMVGHDAPGMEPVTSVGAMQQGCAHDIRIFHVCQQVLPMSLIQPFLDSAVALLLRCGVELVEYFGGQAVGQAEGDKIYAAFRLEVRQVTAVVYALSEWVGCRRGRLRYGCHCSAGVPACIPQLPRR